MSMSANERKRRQLERERQEQHLLEDSTYPYLKTPFYQYQEVHPTGFDASLNFGLMGLDFPLFIDDSGPEQHVSEDIDPGENPDELFGGFKGSIGRAENMIDQLLFAAQELADFVNEYKKDELTRRLAELEDSDLTDKDSRKAALEQAAHISELLKELDKQVRWSFRKWKIKGL
ncbi:hypothetical protein [Allosediminivita pacifica]|uniref:Uncharacterized protein n=1 Tax=Allosediminivita pacifica TaxID=1267769 RepID=A0A2T6A0N8_9RHOB|nr:hypothetical protein [Allosediminivita pacifica]PTX37390.1 hypothetical protein C8N44_15116 [Allosediminivita pacifica]GGB30177.1 hypothetical protein GCM10011324_44630 [Allosediminivita pacifica]